MGYLIKLFLYRKNTNIFVNPKKSRYKLPNYKVHFFQKEILLGTRFFPLNRVSFTTIFLVKKQITPQKPQESRKQSLLIIMCVLQYLG